MKVRLTIKIMLLFLSCAVLGQETSKIDFPEVIPIQLDVKKDYSELKDKIRHKTNYQISITGMAVLDSVKGDSAYYMVETSGGASYSMSVIDTEPGDCGPIKQKASGGGSVTVSGSLIISTEKSGAVMRAAHETLANNPDFGRDELNNTELSDLANQLIKQYNENQKKLTKGESQSTLEVIVTTEIISIDGIRESYTETVKKGDTECPKIVKDTFYIPSALIHVAEKVESFDGVSGGFTFKTDGHDDSFYSARLKQKEHEKLEKKKGFAKNSLDWSLSADIKDEKVVLNVEADDCYCKSFKKEEPAIQTITVKAKANSSDSKGKFTALKIISDFENDVPKEISSTKGNSEASFTMEVYTSTKPVKFVAEYTTSSGRVYRSKPKYVEFCFLDEIDFPNNENESKQHVYSGNGELRTIPKAPRTSYNGKEPTNDDVVWIMDDIGNVRYQWIKTDSNVGTYALLKYTRHPADNSDFGKKKITLTPSNPKCKCKSEKEIEVFFNPYHKTNPEGKNPNWFYYWMQTKAAKQVSDGAAVSYASSISAANDPADVPLARFISPNSILLSDMVIHSAGDCTLSKRGPGIVSKGIDCFAMALKHENQHYKEFLNMRKSNVADKDKDGMTEDIELAFGCKDEDLTLASVTTLADTYDRLVRETRYSCPVGNSLGQRPFDYVTDAEIFAYKVGWSTPVGSYDSEDWSCKGKQWKQSPCAE